MANLILLDLVQFGGLTNFSQVCAGAGGICEGGDRLGDGGLWDGPPVLHHHVREAPRHPRNPRGGVSLSQGLILLFCNCICIHHPSFFLYFSSIPFLNNLTLFKISGYGQDF